MSTATSLVCDQCKGVIPTGAACIRDVNAVLSLATGTQAYTSLDFCCTGHLVGYFQSQPVLPAPNPAYRPLP